MRMRRQRPLTSFYAARKEENDDSLDYSAPIREGDTANRKYPYLLDRKQTTPQVMERAKVTRGETSRSSSSGRGRGHAVPRDAASSSRLDSSSISFHLAPAVGATTLAPAAAPPQSFYDGPSMQDSIPALLRQLTKASLSSSTLPAATLSRGASSERRSGNSPPRSGPKAKVHDSVSGVNVAKRNSFGLVHTNAASPVRHIIGPEQNDLGPSSITATSTAEMSHIKAHSVKYDGSKKEDRLSHVSGAATHVRPRPETEDMRLSRRSRLSNSYETLPQPLRPSNERGGMRYVVVQPRPTAKHAPSYALTTESNSAHGPTRVLNGAGHAYVDLASQASPSTEESVRTSARSQKSTSQSVESGRSRSSESWAGERYSDLKSGTEHQTGSTTTPLRTLAVPERSGATSSSGAAGSLSMKEGKRADCAAAPFDQTQPSAAAAAAIGGGVGARSSNAHSSTLDVASGDDAASTSSLHNTSTTRMRNLFASLLDKSGTLNTRLSYSDSTRASTLHSHVHDDDALRVQSAARQPLPASAHHGPAHTRTIASPLARPPDGHPCAVVGGVESRGATPAALSPPHTAAATTKAVPTATLAPFAEAVMEGGDPMVLRHTIDYLLSKARRLERENAALWEQSHSWNPQRRSLSSPETVTVPLPQRAVKAARSQPSRKSAAVMPKSTATSSSQTRAAATCATQTEHPPSRIFVQRQRRFTAAGLPPSAIEADEAADAASPSSSSVVSTPSAQNRSVNDIVGNEMMEEAAGTATPRTAHRSITVSSPSAEVDTTNTAAQSETSAFEAASLVHQRPVGDDTLSVLSHPHHQTHAEAVQRAEAAVQHGSSSRDAATSTQMERSSHQPTETLVTGLHAGSRSTLSSAATAAATYTAAQAKSLLSSSLRTPTQRSVHLAGAANSDDGDGLAATPLASTVRSHHSVESRRSIGSMTASTRVAPLHSSALQAVGQSSASATRLQMHSQRSTVEERLSSAANAVSNASFGSIGRPPTYNKQVQTASILSPAEDDSDGEALLDSNTDGAATNLSTERTSVIELHTSAAYTRNTVRRLRAYCSSLETTRQQLRRHVLCSPTSLATSVATSVGSRAFAFSSRSSSPNAFPLPRAQTAATLGVAPATPTKTVHSQLSRPFFRSEYANPEVDATLHDVEETPAVETMIVLQEDGSGTVSKRVVDGSPSRVSASAGRSPSPTSYALQRQRHHANTMASSSASYSGLEVEEVYSSSLHGSSRAASQPVFLAHAYHRHESQRASAPGRRGKDDAPNLFSSSVRSDINDSTHVKEVVVAPNVHLGRSTRSESASSWPAAERREGRSPDIAPLAHGSATSGMGDHLASGRFALPPSPSLSHAGERLGISSASALPSSSPYVAALNSADRHAAVARPTPTSDAGDVTARASSTSSQRFAVRGADTVEAAVARATSSALSISSSRSRSPQSQGSSPLTMAENNATLATPMVPSVAAIWDPKASAPTPPPSHQELSCERKVSASKTSNPVSNTASAFETQPFLMPPPPPPPPPSAPTTATTAAASASSSQTSHTQELDVKTPRELTATAAATGKDTAVLAGHDAGVSEYCDGSLSLSHEGNHSDPSSPAPHTPPSGGGVSSGGRRCQRSTTHEFLDEVARGKMAHQLVYAREFTALTQAISDAFTEGIEDVADGFDEADELVVPEAMPIDMDSVSSTDLERVHETRPAATQSRFISPSPPPEPMTPQTEAEASHAEESFVEGSDLGNALDVSETSSAWQRRRTMPPMQRPPIAPSRMVVVDEDTSPSASLSRSLHSFSSSSPSASDRESGEDVGNDGEESRHSEWF